MYDNAEVISREIDRVATLFKDTAQGSATLYATKRKTKLRDDACVHRVSKLAQHERMQEVQGALCDEKNRL